MEQFAWPSGAPGALAASPASTMHLSPAASSQLFAWRRHDKSNSTRLVLVLVIVASNLYNNTKHTNY